MADQSRKKRILAIYAAQGQLLERALACPDEQCAEQLQQRRTPDVIEVHFDRRFGTVPASLEHVLHLTRHGGLLAAMFVALCGLVLLPQKHMVHRAVLHAEVAQRGHGHVGGGRVQAKAHPTFTNHLVPSLLWRGLSSRRAHHEPNAQGLPELPKLLVIGDGRFAIRPGEWQVAWLQAGLHGLVVRAFTFCFFARVEVPEQDVEVVRRHGHTAAAGPAAAVVTLRVASQFHVLSDQVVAQANQARGVSVTKTECCQLVVRMKQMLLS